MPQDAARAQREVAGGEPAAPTPLGGAVLCICPMGEVDAPKVSGFEPFYPYCSPKQDAQ